MATKKIERGPTAQTVAENVKRLMKARGWSYEGMSRELGRIGRPILSTGVLKIVNGTRRVDVDDLMALAVALQVNPSALLLPESCEPDETYEITGAAGLPAGQVWDWADGRSALVDPGDDESDAMFQLRARPRTRRSWRGIGRGVRQIGEHGGDDDGEH